MIVARLARFCLGYSGVSAEVAQALAGMLNHAVHPKVPMTGSIGEADLPPLAHIALVLVGEGEPFSRMVARSPAPMPWRLSGLCSHPSASRMDCR